MNKKRLNYHPLIGPLWSGLLAAFCYLSAFLGVFFLLPLELRIRRHHFHHLLYSILTLAITILLTRLLQQETFRTLLQEIVSVALLVGGLLALHLSTSVLSSTLKRWNLLFSRRLIRLLACTVLWALIATPFVLRVVVDGTLIERLLQDTGPLRGELNLPQAEEEQLVNLTETVVQIVAASYMPLYLLILAFTWHLGNILSKGSSHRRYPLENYQAPPQLLWPLVAGYALLLLGTRLGSANWIYLIWNITLTLSLCYLFQGIAIILFQIKKRSNHPTPENWLTIIFVGAIFLPVINVIVYIGTTLLGLMEHWIDMGRGVSKLSTSKERGD